LNQNHGASIVVDIIRVDAAVARRIGDQMFAVGELVQAVLGLEEQMDEGARSGLVALDVRPLRVQIKRSRLWGGGTLRNIPI